jgi:hypothetical protein
MSALGECTPGALGSELGGSAGALGGVSWGVR